MDPFGSNSEVTVSWPNHLKFSIVTFSPSRGRTFQWFGPCTMNATAKEMAAWLDRSDLSASSPSMGDVQKKGVLFDVF